VNEMLELF